MENTTPNTDPAGNDDTMQCPDCERDHSNWTDKGTAGTPPGHRGVLDLWECDHCGFTLEGARL